MDYINELFTKKIPQIFSTVALSPVGIIELVVMLAVMYCVFLLLSKNNAIKLSIVFLLYLIVSGGMCILLKARPIDYLILLVLAIVFVMLLFATEIKRNIWNTKKIKRVSSDMTESAKSTVASVNRSINEIIKAIQNMSKNDVGAIIVLSNTKIPDNIVNSGVRVNASISSALIESVFFPKTPLHDGAMIIQGDKIMAAGCFLPLSQENDLPKDLGTRHRAGIGITETINVTSIIVSEETGIVSYAQQGKITRYADSEMLRKVLKDFYWQDLIKIGRAHV